MLSVDNLRNYCRTCLFRLEKNGGDKSNSILINKFPDLKHLIQVCLARTSVCEDNLCVYVPFLCRSCFDKWTDFTKLYQLAIKTDEQIRIVLGKDNFKTEIKNKELCKNINEYFINTETLVDTHQVEKYETDSPFYTNSHLCKPINNIKLKDDRTQSNSKFKHNTTNLIQWDSLQTEDDVSSSSYNADGDFTSKLKNKRLQIKNAQKKSNAKNNFILKNTYKTRNSSLMVSEKYVPTKKEKGNIADLNGNRIKKMRYECKQCNKFFWEKIKYDGHMKQVHEGIRRPYKCQQCDKAYNLYKTLLQHIRECHSEKPQDVFKCNQCNKIFKTGVILKQHISNKHSKQKETVRSICDQCGFIAAHQYSLSRHIINKHTKTDQIKCDQCPKAFKTRYSLKYHVISNHNPSNIRPFKCPECQMGFTRKTLLNQHKRTHLKYNERIKCDFEGCEVRFVKHGDKTHHIRLVHLKVKQHVCDFCGEAFGAMQTLRHHRFIHTGEKPYKCNVCGQGFRQRTAMKTHRKTHFGKESESQDLNNFPEINLSLVNNLIS